MWARWRTRLRTWGVFLGAGMLALGYAILLLFMALVLTVGLGIRVLVGSVQVTRRELS